MTVENDRLPGSGGSPREYSLAGEKYWRIRQGTVLLTLRVRPGHRPASTLLRWRIQPTHPHAEREEYGGYCFPVPPVVRTEIPD